MPSNHLYTTYECSTGATLHVLRTQASNIKLVDYNGNGNIEDNEDFGVNGGFFSTSTMNPLSIAISDGTVICNSNNWLGGGVVGYNGSNIFCMTDVQNASSVTGCNRSGTWAQGGFSMWLGDSDWRAKMLEETPMPDHYNVKRQRTVLVADTTNKIVWLIVVTTNSFTFEGIRDVVKEYMGVIGYTITDTPNGVSRFKGLILDGGSSSQMRVKNSGDRVIFKAANENRDLHQCIVLRNQN